MGAEHDPKAPDNEAELPMEFCNTINANMKEIEIIKEI
jgi:hypothetical protein